MCDVEMPEAFNQLIRKARKEHECCECCLPINSGDKYEYSSGIWDGRPDSFKTCLSCVEIRKDYENSTREPSAFGELGNQIHELFYSGFGPKEYAEHGGFDLHRIMIFFPDYYED